MNIDEIREKLIKLDLKASLIISDEDECSCYIVGGGAFVLLGYISRSTRDIDIIEVLPKALKDLFDSQHIINDSVLAYTDCFADGFEDRAIRILPETKKIQFFTLSPEDLVISKLCSSRGAQDFNDIENESVYKDLNWELLDELVNSMETTMISSESFRWLKANYSSYRDKYKT